MTRLHDENVDVTGNVGRIHATLDRVFRDLCSLANEFHLALTDAGASLPQRSEYSPSTNGLALKGDHLWLFANEHGDGPTKRTEFGAVLAVLNSTKGVRRLAREGRPEIWFILGTVLRGSVKPHELRVLDQWDPPPQPALTVSGPPSHYSYEKGEERWDVALLGYELGAISSADQLRQLVVEPLLAFATEKRITPT